MPKPAGPVVNISGKAATLVLAFLVEKSMYLGLSGAHGVVDPGGPGGPGPPLAVRPKISKDPPM